MKFLTNTFHRLLIVVLVFQLSGCGTLLYPERKGQKSGHLDAGVVILDAIGLLFFLIPGIIAFAVDFSNGTIYLPAMTPITKGDKQDVREVKFDPHNTTLAEIENIIQKETGRKVVLTREDVKVSRLKSKDQVAAEIAKADISGEHLRLALAN